LRRAAPFKKLLFFGSLAVFGLLLLYVPVRFFWRALKQAR
jgi:hypothetical protein